MSYFVKGFVVTIVVVAAYLLGRTHPSNQHKPTVSKGIGFN